MWASIKEPVDLKIVHDWAIDQYLDERIINRLRYLIKREKWPCTSILGGYWLNPLLFERPLESIVKAKQRFFDDTAYSKEIVYKGKTVRVRYYTNYYATVADAIYAYCIFGLKDYRYERGKIYEEAIRS